MSRGITLTVLGAAALTACVCGMPWGRRQPDRTWYDAQGHAIAENWKTDETGKRVPDPHPYDRYGRQWVYDSNGNLVPPPPPAGSSSSHRSGGLLWLWGGNGYRSYGGSSSPPRSSSSPPRGGFGSTGSSSSSS